MRRFSPTTGLTQVRAQFVCFTICRLNSIPASFAASADKPEPAADSDPAIVITAAGSSKTQTVFWYKNDCHWMTVFWFEHKRVALAVVESRCCRNGPAQKVELEFLVGPKNSFALLAARFEAAAYTHI